MGRFDYNYANRNGGCNCKRTCTCLKCVNCGFDPRLDWVKPVSIKLVSATVPLSTQH